VERAKNPLQLHKNNPPKRVTNFINFACAMQRRRRHVHFLLVHTKGIVLYKLKNFYILRD